MAEDLLERAYEEYEATQDFTVAVEEEFAILDPETLSLTGRFEDLKAAAQGTELEQHRRQTYVGRIASAACAPCCAKSSDRPSRSSSKTCPNRWLDPVK